MELRCLLPGPSGQEQLMALWRKADRHAPPGRLSLGTARPQRTGLAGWLRKPHRDDRLAFGILAAMPRAAVLALRTGHDVVLPVDGKPRDIEGARGMRLPTGIHMHRSNQVNSMLVAALQDPFGADIAGVDQMLLRQEVLLRELRVDRLERVVVLLGGGRRLDLGDKVRQVVVTALRQMYLVADPVEITLAAVPDLLVVGRAIPLTDRQHLLRGEALRMAVDLAILLRPRLLQDADGGQVLEPGPLWLRGGLVKAGEQGVTILANGRAQGSAFGLFFG